MPLKEKFFEKKLCEKCGENSEDKFSECVYDICKECKRAKSSKEYLCKYCGISDKTLFYEGRYGNCKKCYNTVKSEKIKIVKFIEGKNDESEKEIKEGISNEEIKKFIRDMISFDTKIVEGQSVKNFLLETKKEIENLNKTVNTLKNDVDRLNIENQKNSNLLLKLRPPYYDNLILTRKDDIEEIKKYYNKKFEEQEKKIEELRSLIMKNKEN